MARRSRPRRIRGPALQRRSGGESRPHSTSAEERSSADHPDRAEVDRAASGCTGKASGAREASCAAESSETSEVSIGENGAGKDGVGKNNSGEDERRAARRDQGIGEARKRTAATIA
jgi:hypothetical protein